MWILHFRNEECIKFLLPRKCLKIYDALPLEAEGRGEKCLTCFLDFNENMLLEAVLMVHVFLLKESWPDEDKDMERIHKLHRLVAYQRSLHWIFQVLRKKRRPVLSCVYTKI